MSDNDKPTCSICGGEGAVTAFGSYESADGTQPCQACNGTGERIAELEAQLAAAQADIAKWKELLSNEMERNLNNVANAQLQIDELTSEYQTWRMACGKARERADAAVAEMQAMVSRLTALADEFQTEETWDGKRNDALQYCAGRLREAIGGEKAADSGEGEEMSKQNEIWYVIFDSRYIYDEDEAMLIGSDETLAGAIEEAKRMGEGNVVVTLEDRPDGLSYPIASQAVYSKKAKEER